MTDLANHNEQKKSQPSIPIGFCSHEPRIEWVDYAKAIGILLVVYGHIARGLYKAGLAFDPGIFALVDSIVYSFHMPLFFFLSGLFFRHSFQRHGGRDLILCKIDTIVYPYLLWSLLQGGIEAGLSSHTNGGVTFSEVFSLLWSPRAQFWFLYALFIVFCVATALYSAFKEKIALPLFALSALAYVWQDALPAGRILGFVENNLVFFMFGTVLSAHIGNGGLSSLRSVLVLALMFVSGQYLFHFELGLNYMDKGWASLLLALVSILFIAALSLRLAKKPNSSIVFIGASSMAIYLMHVIAGSGARIVLQKVLDINSLPVHLLAGCAAGVLLPIVALTVIKRLKIPYAFSMPITEAFRHAHPRRLTTA